MITMTIDGQWGSTGKGRLAAWLALNGKPKVTAAVTDCGPNAGHTAEWIGKKIVSHQLPVAAWINPHIPIYIGPGAIIDLDRFFHELESIENKNRVKIHDRAAITSPLDRDVEDRAMRHIASTMTGTGEAWKRKLSRPRQNGVVSDFKTLWPYLQSDMAFRKSIDDHVAGGNLLIESSQGFGLSIDHGFYPYTTHRNITPPALLDRCGITSLPDREDVYIWASIRAHPIRVGNVDGGESGPHWGDQRELTWEELGQKPELTSTTKRVRRVFTWSDMQYRNFLMAVRPTSVCFSFLDYLPEPEREPWLLARVCEWDKLIRGGPDRVMYATGPDVEDMRELMDF